jgi:uncharacterized protein YcfJ
MTGFTQIATSDDVQVTAGSRVRIAAPIFGSKKQVGTVVSVNRDTLVLRQGASTTHQSIPTSDITALEVSKGSSAAFGAVAGGIVGALFGTFFGRHATDAWAPATIGTK